MGTFIVSSRFEKIVVPNYEIKFEKKRMKNRKGLDLLKKGIEGSERNLKCEIKVVKLITTPGFNKKNVKNLDNNEICKKATVINKNDKKVWGSYLINKKYVKEAKIRGLDCGVYNRDKEIEKEKKFAKRLALAEKKLEEEKRKKKIALEKARKKKKLKKKKKFAKRLALIRKSQKKSVKRKYQFKKKGKKKKQRKKQEKRNQPNKTAKENQNKRRL